MDIMHYYDFEAVRGSVCNSFLHSFCLLFCVKRTGNSNVVLNEADVVLCFSWEVVPLPGCRRVRLPTREGLILNLHFVQNVHVGYD